MLSRFSKINDYTNLELQITKKDGIYSIIYFLYYMLTILLFGLLLFKTQIYKNLGSNFSSKPFFRFLFYIPFVIIEILPIFIILKIRNQSISSIGLKTNSTIRSILIGVIGSIPFSILNMIGPISSGMKINPNFFDLLWTFLYFFICIAFSEELAFRGFLQTRIQGLIINKWLGMVVVGLLFGFMHIPFQMLKANMSLVDFILSDMSHLITTCVIHIYLVFLFRKSNNLIAPIVTHTIMDFSYAMFV